MTRFRAAALMLDLRQQEDIIIGTRAEVSVFALSSPL